MKPLAALLLTAALGAMGHLRAQAPDEADLARLEAALAAAPDDLQAGNDYRMAVIRAAGDKTTAKYDRAIAFFEKLVGQNPNSANLHLNHGFAIVDKIPAAGTITQVILANTALGSFTRSIDLKPTWIGYYTRGNSYLFWPRIFMRTKYGIADLEEAVKIQKADRKRSYYVRTYVSLGDGYWKMDDLAKATATWHEGLVQFPDSAALKSRLGKQGEELQKLIDDSYDPSKRVDTSLQDLWTNQ
jgi:tetratricopeptide (TPR) repeat protein